MDFYRSFWRRKFCNLFVPTNIPRKIKGTFFIVIFIWIYSK